MASAIKLVSSDGQTRRVTTPKSYAELVNLVDGLFGAEFPRFWCLQYVDDEDDRVTLGSEAEWQEAIRGSAAAGMSCLKLFVHETAAARKQAVASEDGSGEEFLMVDLEINRSAAAAAAVVVQREVEPEPQPQPLELPSQPQQQRPVAYVSAPIAYARPVHMAGRASFSSGSSYASSSSGSSYASACSGPSHAAGIAVQVPTPVPRGSFVYASVEPAVVGYARGQA